MVWRIPAASPGVAWTVVASIIFISASVSPASAGTGQQAVEAALLDKIDSLSDTVVRPDERQALKTFYEGRSYRPVWFDGTGPTRNAALVINELNAAPSWGLKADDFPLSQSQKLNSKTPASADQVAAAEYELSASILRYARQARGSRITEPDRQLSDYLDRRPLMFDASNVLGPVTTASEPAAALRSFHPHHEQFQKLHDLYVKLQGGNAKAEDLVTVPLKGPLLVPGRSNPDVGILRQRLGVAKADGADDLYDGKLVDAVKAFQSLASLDDDGIVGPETRKALNKARKEFAGDKLKAIVATMEQWRWMPDDLGSSHLLINIPAFSIDFVRNGASVLNERIIAGKPDKPTPVFSKNMTSVVLRPSWFLPDSIKLEKLLSAKRRGRSLEDEGIVVKKGKKVIDSTDVDWENADLRQYSIYQPSGDGNALGDVKFLFPNKHSVYLHDTPAKSLFDASERLYSHGCVRLRNPLTLAQRILDADKGAGAFKVSELVKNGPGSNEIFLSKPLPVHIGYFTVWVDSKGEAAFLGDPYGHDERIALALDHKWDEIAKQVEPVSPSQPTAQLAGQAGTAADVAAKKQAIVSAKNDSGSAPRSAPAPKRIKYFPPPQGLIHANASSGGNHERPKKVSSHGPARPSGYVGSLMHSAYIP